MPAVTKKTTKSKPVLPRLEDVSESYGAALADLHTVRERATRVEAILRERKLEWQRALRQTAELPDIEAVLDGHEPHTVSAPAAEERFRQMQRLAIQARVELAAAETKVRNARAREAGKLLRAPEIRAERTTRLRTMLDGLEAFLDAANGLGPVDDFLTRELGSPTAGAGVNTVRMVRLETPLDVIKRLHSDLVADIGTD